jgi:tRNA-dihydrouridine synthase
MGPDRNTAENQRPRDAAGACDAGEDALAGTTPGNATRPSPAIAPGVESLDPRAIAAELGSRPGGPADPIVRALVPAFDAPFFQAGLAGYSDAAMRLVARRHGCPFCVTEALLDRTLLAGGRGFAKADLGDLHDNIPGGPEDHPLACQIMGSDPAEMAAAALKAAEQGRRGDRFYRTLAYDHLSPAERADVERTHLRNPGGEQVVCGEEDADVGNSALPAEPNHRGHGSNGHSPESRATNARHGSESRATADARFEVIDVNLACPVKKIKSKARGGHWLADPAGAIRILEAVRDAVPAAIPCTLKLRRSYDDTPEMAANFERIFEAAYRIGYAWTTVHARTVQQKYIGPSRWTFLRDLVRRHPGRLVFGSGDIWEAADIFRMIGYTGVHAVSVARGCIGNPWIFRQARDMLAGRPPRPPTVPEQRAVLEEHFGLAVRVSGESPASRTMRKFGIRFAAHHPQRETVRQRFIAVTGTADWRAVLDEHYAV